MNDRAINVFTTRAQIVLVHARKQADRRRDDFVSASHLFLGLLELGQGVAVNVLRKQGLELDTVRVTLERQIGIGPTGTDQQVFRNIPYTPCLKKVLALGAKEAKVLGHNYVGTEHILLGILREGGSPAARVLKGLHLDAEQIREEILKELELYPSRT